MLREQQRALKHQLRDYCARQVRVDDHLSFERGIAPDAVEVDRSLVEGLDDVRIVAVASVLALQLNVVVGVRWRRSHDMQRIVGKAAGDRRRT